MATTRRNFLKALACVPAAPVLLRGMSWAAPTEAELAAEHKLTSYSAEVPSGTILPYVGDAAPPGFLPCDGRAVPTSLYPKLHEAIGDAYGAETRFRFRRFHVPDLRARSRPAAALRADRRAIEHGTPPIYTAYQFSYVIKS